MQSLTEIFKNRGTANLARSIESSAVFAKTAGLIVQQQQKID
jgi:hypothetical protein